MDCYLPLVFAVTKDQIILSLFYIIVVCWPWPVAKHHTAALSWFLSSNRMEERIAREKVRKLVGQDKDGLRTEKRKSKRERRESEREN